MLYFKEKNIDMHIEKALELFQHLRYFGLLRMYDSIFMDEEFYKFVLEVDPNFFEKERRNQSNSYLTWIEIGNVFDVSEKTYTNPSPKVEISVEGIASLLNCSTSALNLLHANDLFTFSDSYFKEKIKTLGFEKEIVGSCEKLKQNLTSRILFVQTTYNKKWHVIHTDEKSSYETFKVINVT